MSFVHYNSAMDFSRGQNTPLHSSPKNATCPTPPWPTPPSNLDGSYSEILPNNLPNRNGLKRMSSFYPVKMHPNKYFCDRDSLEDVDNEGNYVTIVRNNNGESVQFQKSRSSISQYDISYPKNGSSFVDMMDHSKKAGIFRQSNNIRMKNIANPKARLSQMSNSYFYDLEEYELPTSNSKKQERSVIFYSSPMSNSFYCRFLMCIFAILTALLLVSTAVLLLLYYSSDSQSDFVTFSFDFIHKTIQVLVKETSQNK